MYKLIVSSLEKFRCVALISRDACPVEERDKIAAAKRSIAFWQLIYAVTVIFLNTIFHL
jgi:hypothetical protein